MNQIHLSRGTALSAADQPGLAAASLRTPALIGLLLFTLIAEMKGQECNSVFVETRASSAQLEKCGFEEFGYNPSNALYTNLTTTINYTISSFLSGSDPAPWFNSYQEVSDYTCYRHMPYPSCVESNFVAGTYSLQSTNEDRRTNTIGCATMDYDLSWASADGSPQLIDGVWQFVGTRTTYAKSHVVTCHCTPCQTGTNVSGPTQTTDFYPIRFDEHVGSVLDETTASATHVTYHYTNEALYIVETTTKDLTGLYGDDVLYSNILSLLPAYSTNWSSGDSASSSLRADHRQGALQKIKYRFALPDSETNVVYTVHYDIVRTYSDNSTFVVGSGSAEVPGTGDPVNCASNHIVRAI